MFICCFYGDGKTTKGGINVRGTVKHAPTITVYGKTFALRISVTVKTSKAYINNFFTMQKRCKKHE